MGENMNIKFHPNQTTSIDTYKTNFSWCLKRMKKILKCEVNERWAVGNDFTTFTSSRARSFVCLKSRSVLLRCDVGVDRLCVRLLLLLILLHSTTLTLLLPPSPHHTLIRYILNSAIEEFQVYLFMCHNIMIVVLCFVVSSSSSSLSQYWTKANANEFSWSKCNHDFFCDVRGNFSTLTFSIPFLSRLKMFARLWSDWSFHDSNVDNVEL